MLCSMPVYGAMHSPFLMYLDTWSSAQSIQMQLDRLDSKENRMRRVMEFEEQTFQQDMALSAAYYAWLAGLLSSCLSNIVDMHHHRKCACVVSARDGPMNERRRALVTEDYGTSILEEALKSFSRPEWVAFLSTAEFHYIQEHFGCPVARQFAVQGFCGSR